MALPSFTIFSSSTPYDYSKFIDSFGVYGILIDMNKKLIVIPLFAIMITALLAGIFAATTSVTFDGKEIATSGDVVVCDGDYLLFGQTQCSNGNPGGDAPQGYQDNLSLIRSVAGTRVTYPDKSPYQNTPTSQLSINALTKAKAIPSVHSNNNGQFRTKCGFSHLAYDDPILAPGQPGKSHLHAFFGNTETNAYSTVNSIADKGGSTCDGGELNRTGYWVPAMLDGKGNVRVPNYITVYYKSGGDPTEYSSLTNYPRGLQKISGDAGASSPQDTKLASWWCDTVRSPGSSTNFSSTIPKCASGENLYGFINFQRCWNGNDIWKGDRSHLAYAQAGGGKAGTPTCANGFKLLPKLQIFLHFEEHDGNTDQWHLSSDVTQSTGQVRGNGNSLHGDWWNGWNPAVNSIWNDRCNKEGRSTVSNLCNGRELDNPQGFETTRLSDFKAASGAKTLIPGSDVVKLCPGKQVPSNPAMLAWCR